MVTRASASAGAKGRGITIPGNLVIGVYRNDFAVRMLKASVPAGIEAPLRFYLTENADKTATLTYRLPTEKEFRRHEAVYSGVPSKWLGGHRQRHAEEITAPGITRTRCHANQAFLASSKRSASSAERMVAMRRVMKAMLCMVRS